MNGESQDVVYESGTVILDAQELSSFISPHQFAAVVEIAPDRLPALRPGNSLQKVLKKIAQRLADKLPGGTKILVRLSAPSVVIDTEI